MARNISVTKPSRRPVELATTAEASGAAAQDLDVKFPAARDTFTRIYNATSSQTKRRQLTNLWTVLVRQAASNSTDFRIVTLGVKTKELGGPSTQTLRNQNGADYRAIIMVFADEAHGSTKPPSTKSPNDRGDHLLVGIQDIEIRNHVRLLLQENRSLRSQLNLLKNHLSRVYPPLTMRDETESDGTSPTELAGQSAAKRLTPGRRQAVMEFLDENAFRTKGWHLNAHGAIVDAFGNEIASPGFAEALRQALQIL